MTNPNSTDNRASVCLERVGDGVRLLVDGTTFIMLGGELHNSSASSLAYVEPLLDRLAAMHLNTVLAPLCWELIEPVEGQFDFSLLDGLVLAARQRGLQLVFLWFGTLKNAFSSYTPAWVKRDTARFFRAQGVLGKSSHTVSVFCAEAMRCDARAFAAVMQRIREIDAEQHTVLMVQVENEAGILGAPRDYCPAADAAFQQAAPAELPVYLAAHRDALIPELAASWTRQGCRQRGSWTELFGAEADEVFMAWHVARFIEHVAAAGHAEYALPLFANAWLIAGPGYTAGQYPSGGPVSKMLDVWHAAAPHIALLAPDIYLQDFRAECASYTRGGNPLLIPEARNDARAAANVLYAIGQHQALCFAPFAIDDLPVDHPLAETYRLLADLMPLLTDAYGTSRLAGFLQQGDEEQFVQELGNYRFNVRTCKPLEQCQVPGAALLLALGDDEFLAVGRNLVFTYTPLAPAARTAELIRLDVGDYHLGQWLPGRRLNGDETAHGTGVVFGEQLTAYQFVLHGFA